MHWRFKSWAILASSLHFKAKFWKIWIRNICFDQFQFFNAGGKNISSQFQIWYFTKVNFSNKILCSFGNRKIGPLYLKKVLVSRLILSKLEKANHMKFMLVWKLFSRSICSGYQNFKPGGTGGGGVFKVNDLPNVRPLRMWFFALPKCTVRVYFDLCAV